MSLKPWKKISDQLFAGNPWWEYRLAKFELPNQKQIDYHYVHGHDVAVSIVANAEGKILLVRQYRALYDMFTIEFPMGAVEKGEDTLVAAHREFAEETGYGPKTLEFVGKFQPSNAILDSWAYVYVGNGLTETGALPEEGEEFEQVLLSPDEIDAMIASGEIVDGVVIAAWAIARPHVSRLV